MARVFPYSDFKSIQIALQHTIFSSKTRGGFVSEVKVADPYWYGELNTVDLSREELATWEAFLTECVDRKLSVDFVHPLYPCPMEYNPETFPLPATGQIEDFLSGSFIEVSGLNPSLVLRKGDRLSIEQGDRVMYYMVSEDAAAPGEEMLTTSDGEQLTDGSESLYVGSGGVYHVIGLTPRLRTGLFTEGATVRVSRARMRLCITPNSVAFALQGGEPVSISFSVYEDGR